MLLWQQNFWITTIGDLTNDDGDGNENGKKAIGLCQHNKKMKLNKIDKSLKQCKFTF